MTAELFSLSVLPGEERVMVKRSERERDGQRGGERELMECQKKREKNWRSEGIKRRRGRRMI